MTTYVFPGQGAQRLGMGELLFSEFPELIQKSDDILGYSIINLCLKSSNEELSQTKYTQPALYIVNALAYFKKLQETQTHPDYVAGHSLGEYNALLAAEVFDFEIGLKLVQKRGELMNRVTGGGAAAVLGLNSVDIQALLVQSGLNNIITIGNYNSYSQVVISGPKDEVNATQNLFEKAGASLFLPLKISGAAHSAYMINAEKQFAEFLEGFTFKAPIIPVISNIDAKPYNSNEIKLNLAKQITHPVQWVQSIEYLLAMGETEFLEIGPGTILTNLIRRIKKGE